MLDIDALVVNDIVINASIQALALFRTNGVDVHNKLVDGFDPVTHADRMVETILRQELQELVGELPVIGEEGGTTGDPSKGFAWIIDPIDGTRAFISGQPQWGTLLGLLHHGQPIGGWLHLPVLNETFWALGDSFGVRSPTTTRFGTSDCIKIADATMLSTDPAMFVGELENAFARTAGAVRLSRFGGDCHNYGLLASGDVDLVVENQMQPYDILPLVPIIEAAGGIVTDHHGAPVLGGGSVVAAATPQLHAQVLEILNS